jgi:hypothetical protein
MKTVLHILILAATLNLLGAVCAAQPQDVRYDYRVLATTKTSTMEKELNEAAADGFEFAAVMGGQTAGGGDEVVVVMIRDAAKPMDRKPVYKLLATSKTGTMQKEIQQLADEGFRYRGQTIFHSAFGGQEVGVIMERDTSREAGEIQYRLVATSRTSTMQKELQEGGQAGFRIVGMTVAKTAFGGSELVSILTKEGTGR